MKERPEPIQSSIARKCVNWLKKRIARWVLRTSLISLNPVSESLLAASVSERPSSELTSCLRASSFERLLIFMPRFQDDQVAGCFPQDCFNRVALEKGYKKAPFACT